MNKKCSGDWVLVPRVPTQEMLEAGEKKACVWQDAWECGEVYRSMLAAAPQTPAEAKPVGVEAPPLPAIVKEVLEWYASDPSVWVAWNDEGWAKEKAAKESGHYRYIGEDKDGHCEYVPNEVRAQLALDALVEWEAALAQQPAAVDEEAVVTDAAAASVFAELDRAVRKFPTWPTDPLHAVAVLGEEFGELTKAVLQSVYEPHKVEPGDVREEALQTAAMALRFLRSVDAYEFAPGAQHEQPALAQQPAAVEEASIYWRAMYRLQTAMRYMDNNPKLTLDRVFEMADEDVARLASALAAQEAPR